MKTKRIQNNNIMSQLEKEEYIKVIEDMPWLYGAILNEISQHASIVKSVIDVACGDGKLLHLIHQKYHHLKLIGLDIDPYFIKEAKNKYNYEFYVANGYDFDYNADLLISNLALHHFDEPNTLIKKMFDKANYGVIISDQIRPETEGDLDRRLDKRLQKHNYNKSEYYKQKGRESILEAYSKDEIITVLEDTQIPFVIKVYDEDYYERFVAVLLK